MEAFTPSAGGRICAGAGPLFNPSIGENERGFRGLNASIGIPTTWSRDAGSQQSLGALDRTVQLGERQFFGERDPSFATPEGGTVPPRRGDFNRAKAASLGESAPWGEIKQALVCLYFYDGDPLSICGGSVLRTFRVEG